jgi:hypothetical protein
LGLRSSFPAISFWAPFQDLFFQDDELVIT